MTPQLREFYEVSDAEADTEELEYAALLGGRPGEPATARHRPDGAPPAGRLAADVPDDAVLPMDDPTPTAVRCG